jgi:CMP-N,N'-diacetyllegionaminic acid synthase
MRVLGLIPARGGSKGVSRKNIRSLCGKPLIQWTAESALAAHRLSRIVLSTDDAEIAEIGRRCGVDVPFMRPPDLAADDTPTLPVAQHAIKTLEQAGDKFDAVCLLQPTSPFRRSVDIDSAIDLLAASYADSVLSVLRVPPEYNPHWVYFRGADNSLRLSTGELAPIARRQLLPPAFHRDGSIYVTRRNVIAEQNSLYGMRVLGYEIDRAQSVNIDTPADWDRAELLMHELVS